MYLGLRYLLPVVIPFLLGWLLALWCYPLARKAEQKFHLPVAVGGAILMIALAGGVAFLLWIGIQEGLQQIRYLLTHYEQLQSWCMQLLNQCCQVLEKHTGILVEDSRTFLVGSALQIQEDFVGDIGVKTVEQATACVRWIFVAVSSLVIAVISGIFILKDMEELKRKIREYSLLQGCRRVLRRLKETAVVYFKAQLFIMLTISLECIVGFWLLKSPYYLLFGIGLGLLDALPLIGTGLFLYPAGLFFLVRGHPVTAVGCVVLELLTSFTREFMEPRMIGKKLGIYPVVVLAAVYLGMVIYGPAGVLLGPMSFFLMYEIGKEWDVWD